jgi:branched-chain amino acid transport system substrate-binding protein
MRAPSLRILPALAAVVSLSLLASCVPPRVATPDAHRTGPEELPPAPADVRAEEAERDEFDAVLPAERYRFASERALRAEREGRAVEAYRWRERAMIHARTPAERQAAENALIAVLEGLLSPEEIRALAESGEDTSPATPLAKFKLAKLYLHLHDWENLEPALGDFLARYPNHRFTPEVRKFAERARARGMVSPHKLGVVVPLSGKYRPFGEQLLAGIRQAFAGSSIQLVVRDDAGDPAQATRVAEELILEQHVIGLVGGVVTQEAQAVALAAQELGVPVISFSRAPDITALGEYVFRDMLTDAQMAEALAAYAVEGRGHGKFGILFPDMAYGQDLAEAFRRAVEARGAKVTGEATYAQDQTTFSEPIRAVVGQEKEAGAAYTNCMAEARKIGNDRRRKNAIDRCKNSMTRRVPFDALFLPDRWQTVALVSAGLAFEDVITNWCDERDIDRIQRTTGTRVQPVMLLGANLWNHPDLPARAGKYVNCSIFVDGFWAGSQRPATAAFVQAFTAEAGRAPGLLEAYGYDAAVALRRALETRRPGDRDDLRDALASLQEVPSAMGPTSVTPDRELVHPLYFLTVDQGTIRETDPMLREGAP